jgi:glycosyltransferase involved in cell wall biosynthesis
MTSARPALPDLLRIPEDAVQPRAAAEYRALVFSEYFPPYMGSDLRITHLASNFRRVEPHFAVTPPMRILADGSEPALQTYFDTNHGSGVFAATYKSMHGTYLSLPPGVQALWRHSRELAYAASVPILVRQARALIERHEPDVVVLAHASYLCGMTGAIAAQRCGKKIVLDYPDAWTPLAIETAGMPRKFSYTEKLLLQLERNVLKRADRVVSITRSLNEYIRTLADVEHIDIVENGAEHTHFNPANARPFRAELGIPEGARVVLMSGRVEGWSGVETIGAVVQETVRRAPDVIFLIVGSGSRLGDLKADIAKRGCDERVIFTGLRPYKEMPSIIGASDVAYIPFPETAATRCCTPVKLIEFAMMNVPVVTTPLPGITELYGGTLDYVDSLAASAVAPRLLRVLDDLAGARERSEFARRMSNQRYRWDALGAKFEDVLLDAIGARPAAAKRTETAGFEQVA